MGMFMKKYGLILKAAGLTLALLVIRLIFDYLNFDILSVTNLITAFIGGAIFTIAIIFTGTLTDYKESEKIPGEIVTSIRTFYSDLDLIRVEDRMHVHGMQEKTAALMRCINTNFRNNAWSLEEMDNVIDTINEDISKLVDLNVPPNFVIKMKTEMTNIDRISHRIKTIAETSFIPAAYAIAELAAAGVIILLFFVKLDPYYEGLVLFTVLCMLLTALLLLIKDMDNPFEVGRNTYADIDLFLLWDLEKKLDEKTGYGLR
jgi:predicted membrane chloride channel (bestrophin family)